MLQALLLWQPTSSTQLLHLLADHWRRQMYGEGQGGLLGVLDDDAGLVDLRGHHVLLLCRLKGNKIIVKIP